MVSVPKGSFYASTGQTLPHRSTPYNIRITTGVASAEYNVYNNDAHIGATTTNGEGLAIVSVLLDLGTNTIKLVNKSTLATVSAYVTTKTFATWLAAIAETVESIDEGIEDTLANSRLATASGSMIEPVFGSTIDIANDFGMDTDTFRNLLFEIRTAYRHYGGTIGGISRIVRAITCISPYIMPFSFMDSWILGADLLYPTNRTESITGYSAAPELTNINTALECSISNMPTTCISGGTGVIEYDGTTFPVRMRWQHPDVPAFGDWVDVVSAGEYVLPGPKLPGAIYSHPGTYSIGGSNNTITLDIYNKGKIDIILPPGPSVTATDVATTINAALSGSPQYGVSYSGVASVISGPGATPDRVKLSAGIAGPIKVYYRQSTEAYGSASTIVFDHPYSRLDVSGGLSPGDYTIAHSADSLSMEDAWPDLGDIDFASGDIYCIVDSGARNFSVLGVDAGSHPLTNKRERVLVGGYNKVSRTITLATPLQFAHDYAIVYFEWDDCIQADVKEYPSVTITVASYADMTGLSLSDTITFNSYNLPDGWRLTTTGTPTTSVPSLESYFDVLQHPVITIPTTAKLVVPAPDNILEYKGSIIGINVYAYAYGVDAADISVGVDFGTSTVVPTSDTYNRLQHANLRPRRKTYFVRVPYDATKADISITCDTTFSQLIEKVTIIAGMGQANRAPGNGSTLGDGTYIYGESIKKRGNAMIVWSALADATAEENAALGMGYGKSGQDILGHIDYISADSASLLKAYAGFEAVHGYFTETHWALGAGINLETILGTPAKYTYLKPTTVSIVTEQVTFSTVGPFVYTLGKTSTSSLSKSILMQDGVPLTQDEWQYNSDTEIELLSTPSTVSTYSFEYEARVQYTTGIIDADPTVTLAHTYVTMLADYHIFSRPDHITYESPESSGIDFDNFGISTLAIPSNQDKSTSRLVEDFGLSKRTVPSSQWSYVDNTSIQIDPTVIAPGSLYTLEYTGNRVHTSDKVQAVVEWRGSDSQVTILTEPWTPVTINSVVGNYRYHQLRVNLTDISDVNDVRINSILVKGIDQSSNSLYP